MSASRPFVRCFADDEEGGLIDEWPVVVSPEELKALVPEAEPGEIVGIDDALVEKLIGQPLEDYEEPVLFFVEPEQIDLG